VRVAIVAEGDFGINNRLLKLAGSLVAAGHAVVRVGIQIHPDEPLHESTGFGEIIRVQTSIEELMTATGPGDPAAPPRLGLSFLASVKRIAARFGPLDDARHYYGRRRECRLIYERLALWKPDVVVCVNPPMMFVGELAQRRLGALFIYDAQELWVDMYTHTRATYRRLYQRLEKRLARRADLVVTVNDEIAEVLAEQLGVQRPLVLMNGAGECRVPTPVHDPLRVFFQGAFAANRGLMTFVTQMEHLRGKATFTLQGYGEMEEALREAIAENRLEGTVELIEPCAPSEVCSSANPYDLGIIVYPLTTPNLVLSSPNKLFDYIGGGLAVLAVDAPVMRRMVGDSGCGVLVDPDALDRVWETIAELAEAPERVTAMKRASHALCPSLLWDEQVKPFLEWLDSRSGR